MRSNHFGERLNMNGDLGQADLAVIAELCGNRLKYGAKTILKPERGSPPSFPVILSGWAARYQILRNGSRQITGVLLPGDACHFDAWPRECELEEIITLCPCTVVFVPCHTLDRLIETRPGIARALRHYARLESAVLASWVINNGRRDALERMAHFISEAHARLAVIGATSHGRFHFPMTQEDFADVVGLTPVHINRKLQQLRREGVITLRGKDLTILKRQSLEQIGGFESSYLYPRRVEQTMLAAA